MAKEIRVVEIDLGSNRTGTLTLGKDVTDYFNIPVSTATTTARDRKRKAHTRKVYKGLDDTTGTTVAVRESSWTDSPSSPKRGAGVAIKVPTELKTSAGNIRMVTMRFPGNAVIGAISKFLFTKCVAHKPTYFITASGERHLVVNVTGNVNPEPTTGPTPTT